MQSNRRHKLTRGVVFAGLAICFCAGLLSAQDFVWKGTFSLPVETYWGGAVLAPGDYSLRLDMNMAGKPLVVIRQGTRTVAMAMVWNTEEPRTPANSKLLIVGRGNQARVHILSAAELKTAFHFRVPEQYEVYTRLITQANEPPGITRIPISLSGK